MRKNQGFNQCKVSLEPLVNEKALLVHFGHGLLMRHLINNTESSRYAPVVTQRRIINYDVQCKSISSTAC
jgi:hypothetical protein